MNRCMCALTLGAASLLTLSQAGCKGRQTTMQAPLESTKTTADIEQLSPELSTIIPDGARLEKMATGFTWTEGPVWVPPGMLMFADIPSNSIRQMAPDGKVTIWLQPSGYIAKEPFGGTEPGTNGMTLDDKLHLTVAGHAARNILRFETMDPKGTKTILADSYEGKPLNSPNDVVYGPDGSLYFTDPPYGLPTQQDDDPSKKLKVNGVYRIPNATAVKAGSAPNRAKLQLLIGDLPRPNGIAISPDNKWLYVADSQQKKWMRYPLKSDGTVGQGTVFLDASSAKGTGTSDGMKVDSQGNLFATGPGGVWIITPEGKHLGTILTEKPTANVAWGGQDGKTLYLTTSDAIYRIGLKVTGYRPWVH
ncbi:SMP-30/gluconolactonase/LRE family protein [Terriglobus albidus]|uniref:SMP-30/gluconolactonase/LRE family protein n=1 Tax=Terriglobus albidus TaxID=1592106 RepID=UPI0021E0A243|nr:SMP-30/gluconolactonase/LRE family protein [Terriglobus albidus]